MCVDGMFFSNLYQQLSFSTGADPSFNGGEVTVVKMWLWERERWRGLRRAASGE